MIRRAFGPFGIGIQALDFRGNISGFGRVAFAVEFEFAAFKKSVRPE